MGITFMGSTLTGSTLTGLFVSLFWLVVSAFVLYHVIRLAVGSALRDHREALRVGESVPADRYPDVK
jgi:ABC-type branched-subunit amino acid transport system permease subunit